MICKNGSMLANPKVTCHRCLVTGTLKASGTEGARLNLNLRSGPRPATIRRQPPAFNSWGFGPQEGFYVVPCRQELARISGVNWRAANFSAQRSTVNTWFAGPNFPCHRVNEDRVGANLYFHKHNAKLQVAYSYLNGNTFDGRRFGAERVGAETQVMLKKYS